MKPPKKNQTSKKSSRSLKFRWRLWLLIPILLLPAAAAGTFIVYSLRHSHIERGQYNISDTYLGKDPAHSLDLKVAAKADYPSSPITVKKNLGTVDGLHQSVFQYQVHDDSLTEYGLMVSPISPAPPDGYPVIILLHGYSNPRAYTTATAYLPEAEFYARHGFLVIKPDLRGQGLSIDSGFADSAYYSMSYNTDVMSLISALRQTKYVDKKEINLWGHSMGAYIALRAAVLSKDIKNVILLSGPVDSLEEMYLTYIPPSDENNPYALATRNEVFGRYGTPADNKTFWNDASPINFLSHIKGSVQIYVGLEDEVVPPRFSADLNDALNRTRVKHQYFAYPYGGHALDFQHPDIYARSLKLLQSGSIPAGPGS